MNDKTIAELIHDRVFAEGGTLNVWLGGAKFRRLTTKVNARTVRSRTEAESMDCLEEFKPSAELAMMMVRHVEDLRDYLAKVSAEWRAQVMTPGVRRSGSARVLPRPFSPPTQNPKGRQTCDCHDEMRLSISQRGQNLSGSALAAVVFAAFVISADDFRHDSEIVGGSRVSASANGVETVEHSRLKADKPGEGAGCAGRIFA